MEPVRRKKKIKRVEDETTFPSVPEGILICILAKLPVKSLLRFRCVSKNARRSLKSDPKFNLSTQRQQVVVMSMPIRESKYQKSVFVHLIDDETSVKELPMPKPLRVDLDFSGPDLWGSCNGLVLVSYDRYFFLWNPLTRRCNKVLSYWGLDNYEHGLARLLICGLCYNSSTDDYKAVIASGTYNVVMVGNFRNKTWAEIHFPHSKKILMSGPTVNDHVHWLVHSGEDQRSQVEPYLIVSFDPQMDEFVVVPMPQNELIKGTIVLGFGVLVGDLSLVLSADHERCELTNVEVFAMKSYGNQASWTSLFIISNVIMFNPIYTSVVPLCFTTKGEVLFQREVKGEVMAYNPERNSYRAVQILSCRCHIYCGTSFVESLVSPHSYNCATEVYTEITLSGKIRKYNNGWYVTMCRYE